MRMLCRAAIAAAVLILLPATVLAQQASITGVIKDASGAVLPGVTVEAASDVLIEKVRSAVSDANGQYRIEDLRPGTYAVTFKLTGFSTVVRQGIELSGSFTAKVDADLKVGGVQETITVTGESPIVDVVNARKQSTIPQDAIAAIPTARLYHSIAALVPGISMTTQDVGGIAGPTTVTFSMRGGPGNEGRLTVDGMSLGASLNGTGVSYTVADVGNAQEIVFTTAGQMGEAEVAGPAMNLVPRQGGNKYAGTFFVNGAPGEFQQSNSAKAIAAGLTAPQELLKIWDVNGGLGGPIQRDRLWFFATVRYQGNRKTAPSFFNANENDPTKWTYVKSTRQAIDDGTWKNANINLTLQATPRNKFNFGWDEQQLCTSCLGSTAAATTAPEAHYNNHAWPRVERITWSSPWTNKLLFEAGWGANLIDNYGTRANVSRYSELIPVTELCQQGCAANGGIPGLTYRSTAVVPFVGAYEADSDVWSWRASATHVSGGRSLKFGYVGTQIVNHFAQVRMNDQWLGYSFNNGQPFSFNQYVGPAMQNTHVTVHGLYAQEQWTLNRFTLSGAVRWDHTAGSFPEQTIGPNPWVPTQIIVPKTKGTQYDDLTPRAAVVYDLFKNGKTALKFNVGKYLAAADGSSITGGLTNPLANYVTNSGARTWIDQNTNFVVDCNVNGVLPNASVDNRPTGGDFCGQGNLNFGNFVTPTTRYDAAILTGWSKRPYDWNFGWQVQQELLPRLSVEVGYFRRIFGNFAVTDNLDQSIFGTAQLTAPSDSRLPNGGGNTIGTIYNVDPTQSGRTNNLVNLSDNLGVKQVQHWNGVEVNFNARVRQGLTLQGGTSTGRTSIDSCEVRAKFPETALLNPYCHVDNPFLTQARGFASYIVPKIDVALSTTFQSLPGSNLSANYAFTNAAVTPLLGRPLSGNAQNITVNLIPTGTLQGDRTNQIDIRAGKVIRFGGYRTQFSVDVYNLLNSARIGTYQNTFIVPDPAALTQKWLAPQAILAARFFKLTAQIDF
jgi:Carboxypeptidase regulatory-like domain